MRFMTLLLLVLAPVATLADTVTIHLAGDSTMSVKRAEKRPETGWGEALGAFFEGQDVAIANHARNGRSTRTFIEEGRWSYLLAETRPGDFVFIQFGHNDQSENKPDRYTPPDAYKANLERFVADVRAREAQPVLLTPVVRRRFDDNGAFYDVHGVYPDLVREVAQATDTPLLDLHTTSMAELELYGPGPSKALFLHLVPAESPNYPDGLEDDTHFSPKGAAVIARLAAEGLAALDIGLSPDLPPSGHRIVRETDIPTPQPGPHQGGGETTAWPFFAGEPGLELVFRKRALHPGAAIGYHPHDKDEIYYVLEGQGELTMNGERTEVGPGTAILTRPGDSHGLRTMGDSDLVILIVYRHAVE